MHNRDFGNYGETLAKEYLLSKGYFISYENFTCDFGEIDLIARYDRYIIFVEVKTRISLEKGLPQESVTPSKQRQIIRTAEFYISKNKLWENYFRFDVVAITFKDAQPVIEHIMNAFYA